MQYIYICVYMYFQLEYVLSRKYIRFRTTFDAFTFIALGRSLSCDRERKKQKRQKLETYSSGNMTLFHCPYVLIQNHRERTASCICIIIIMNNWPRSRHHIVSWNTHRVSQRFWWHGLTNVKSVSQKRTKRKKKRDKIKSGKLSSSKQGFAQYIRGQDMIIRNIVSLLACVGLFVRQNLLMLVSKIRVGAQDRSSPPRGYDSHRATYCPPIISTGNNNKYRLVCAENKKIPLKRGIT